MEDNRFVLHGPEPFMPIPEVTLGKLAYDKLVVRNPNQIAMIDAVTKETITYWTILEQACSLSEALRRYGCDNNTVVSISSENVLEFYIPVFASLFTGTILAPINPIYQDEELEHSLNITKPRIIFVSEVVAPRFLDIPAKLKFVDKIIIFNTKEHTDGAYTLEEFLDEQLHGHRVYPTAFSPFNRNPEDQIAFIMCSSGTTGLPKGVMLTHTNVLVRSVTTWDPRYAPMDDEEKVLALMPFFHGYGLNLGLHSIINGHLVVVLKGFDEDIFLQTIQDFKIITLALAPPLAVFLAKSPKVDNYDLSCVREAYCGAAPLSQDTEEALKKRLKIKYVYQAYGLTETNLAVTLMERNVIRPGSVGKVLSFMSVKLRDPETGKSVGPNKVGEICVKGPQVMKGYYNNPQATRETFTSDGWLRTGDMAYYDEEGYFYIVDRLKELIKYKAYQVAPAELEGILLTHPKVADAGVVGLPDELAGELPVAFVVKKDDSVTEKELQDYVASKVSPQKRLRGGVIFVNDIPKNPSGKILRKQLRIDLKEYQSKLKSKL